MEYDAFISYSHAADEQLAPRLQQGLQRLAKPWYRMRSLRVFRDDTGLSANPGLWSSISDALESSRYFVLMASPQAAASEWVNREVEQWLAIRSADTILPVLTEGEWVWDPATNDFDWGRSTAVPAALRGAFAEEPRHVDLGWARAETDLDLRHSRFRDVVAQLAAPIHGRSKDELEGDDIRQHRRTMRITWAAAVLLLFLTVAAGIGAWTAVGYANESNDQRELAEHNEALALDNQRKAEASAAEAARNAEEAARNAEEAIANAEEAQANFALAEQNAAEARTNLGLAEHNAAEALSNLSLAEQNQARAEREAARARDQERLAQDEAARALAAEAAAETALVAEQAAREAEKAALDNERAARVAEEFARLQAETERDRAEVAQATAETERDRADLERQRAEEERDRAEEQARLATSSALGATSVQGSWSTLFLLAEQDMDQRLLVAVEAFRTATTTTAINGLHTLSRVVENGLVGMLHVRTPAEEISFMADVAVSDDGSTTVAADAFGAVSVWRQGPYSERVLPGAGAQISDLAVGPSGRWLVTRSSTGPITRWNLTTGASQALPGMTTVANADASHVAVVRATTVAFVDLSTGAVHERTGQLLASQPFSPDGRFAIGTSGTQLVLWDLADSAAPIAVGVAGNTIAFTPDGSRFAVGTAMPAVFVWDVSAAGPLLFNVLAVPAAPTAMDLSSDGTAMLLSTGGHIGEWSTSGGVNWSLFVGVPIESATYSPDGVTTTWTITGLCADDPSQGCPYTFFLQPHSGLSTFTETSGGFWFDAAEDTVFAAHVATRDALGRPDYQMHVVDLRADGAEVKQPTGMTFIRARTSPDERYVATTGATQVWDTHDADVTPATLPGATGTIDLVFDGSSHLVGTGVRPYVSRWELARPFLVRSVAGFPAGGEPVRPDVDWSAPSAVSPSGTTYAHASGATVSVRRVSDKGLVGSVTVPSTVAEVQFTPDAKHLVVRRTGTTQHTIVSLAGTPTAVGTIPGPPAAMAGAASRIGVLDAVARELRVYALSTGAPTLERSVDVRDLNLPGARFAFDATGKKLAGTDLDADIAVWDVASGTRLARVAQDEPLQGLGATVDVAVTPDGSKLAAKLTDGRVQVWEVGASALAFDGLLPERLTSVSRLRISPDGRFLVTAPHVTLWDINARSMVGPTLSSDVPAGTRTAIFTTDGRYVISRGETGLSRFLIDGNQLATRACALVRRNLTAEEWERLVPLGDRRATCAEWPLP